jgi:hypothetical protein
MAEEVKVSEQTGEQTASTQETGQAETASTAETEQTATPEASQETQETELLKNYTPEVQASYTKMAQENAKLRKQMETLDKERMVKTLASPEVKPELPPNIAKLPEDQQEAYRNLMGYVQKEAMKVIGPVLAKEAIAEAHAKHSDFGKYFEAVKGIIPQLATANMSPEEKLEMAYRYVKGEDIKKEAVQEYIKTEKNKTISASLETAGAVAETTNGKPKSLRESFDLAKKQHNVA